MATAKMRVDVEKCILCFVAVVMVNAKEKKQADGQAFYTCNGQLVASL